MLRSYAGFGWAGIVLILSSELSLGQSSDKNYIISRTYKEARNTVSGNVKDASQQVNYMDGLGRPLQSIAAHASPQLYGGTPADLVSHTEYDAYGRVSRVFAPYPVPGNGGYQSLASQGSLDYYNNESHFNLPNNRGYALTAYEPSPLNRVIKQYAVGSDRAVEYAYGVNGGGEVKKYGVAGNTLTDNGHYDGNQLTYTEVKDENGNAIREYKDKSARTILKRLINADLNTYYVYDDFSQLRFVLQPKFQEEGNTDKYAFRYQYNDRGLVSSKYVPGAGTTTMAYDSRDRLEESTDANGQTTFVKYDDLNRVTMTGEKRSGTEHALIQTHYVDYGWNAQGFQYAGDGYPGGYRGNIKGKAAVTASRIIDPDGNYGAWLYATTYYDDRYNVIQTIRSLFDIGGTSTERVTRQLRFDGRVEKELTVQQTGTGTHSVEKFYTYDHADRLLSTRYVVKNGDAVSKHCPRSTPL